MNNLKNEIVSFIKSYVEKSGAKGVIVGMSGGKDSFVVAKLCALAIGNNKVFGLIMPNGKMVDFEDAKAACEILKIKYAVSNIENVYNETISLLQGALQTDELTKITTLNIAPRIRMNMLYSAGGTLGYLVANTSNLSERMIGYSTKWGDSVGDFSPLSNLTKTEVCELGISLGLPENLINKPPADGLTGSSDEQILGFSYSEVDDFIRNGKKSENFEKILKMFNSSRHKRENIPTFKPNKPNHFDEI